MSELLTDDFYKFTLGFLAIITLSLLLVFGLQSLEKEASPEAEPPVTTSSATTTTTSQ